MRKRLLPLMVWLLPALVLGSTVMPALHQAAHPGAKACFQGTAVQADEQCTLCAGAVADALPPAPAPVPLCVITRTRANVPPAPDCFRVPVKQGRAPPIG